MTAKELFIKTNMVQINGYQLSALILAESRHDNVQMAYTRDTYIWSALLFDLIYATKGLQEKDIDEALNHALIAFSLARKELLSSGLDFISYLNNRHVPLKDLIIEFVDYIFKKCKDDNNDHYLHYVYDIIAFIENSYINSNQALSTLALQGYLEETYNPANNIIFDLVPLSCYKITEKGNQLLTEIKVLSPEAVPTQFTTLLNMEPIVQKILRIYFKPGNI